MPPHELVGDNRFTAYQLWKAWANIRNDIDSSMLKGVGKFKEITAGDEIYVENKHEEGFYIQPTAKHIYSANTLPDINEDDDAFFRRIILVSFPHTVPEPERDPHLLEDLKEELPGILNWAVDGLERLMDQGRFTGDLYPGETRQKWEEWGDSISRFKNTCLVKEPDAILPKSVAYEAYTIFGEEYNLPVMSQRKVTRELKRDSGIDDGDRTPEGHTRQVSCYLGVRLEEEWADRVEHQEDDGDDDDDVDPDGRLDDY